MSYARARLWLGISGVGTIVLVSLFALISEIPTRWLERFPAGFSNDLQGLLFISLTLAALMIPFDLIGGYLLPRHYGRQVEPFQRFVWRWVKGVSLQVLMFTLVGLSILAVGRWLGVVGAVLAISGWTLTILLLQGAMARFLTRGLGTDATRLDAATRALHVPVWAVEHDDPGFTGGIVGLPSRESILVPQKWLDDLDEAQLETALKRRLVAIESGARTRGLIVALVWVIAGFVLATMLPGAGVTTVASLAMTCCGFTLWTFLGLLILPTISRRASYQVDRAVLATGTSSDTLRSTLSALDVLQDDEPKRAPWIEAIFHPVPSLSNRTESRDHSGGFSGWHAARMTLLLSWACLGLLARAVHCNAGRPELWVMLPTDLSLTSLQPCPAYLKTAQLVAFESGSVKTILSVYARSRTTVSTLEKILLKTSF